MTEKLLPMLMCALFSLPLHAQLKWDTQKAELFPTATDAFAEARFGFVNAGQADVEIASVHSSCGCTIPTLAKTSYAPGERGEVLARFTIGDRQGVNTKNITVAFKDGREPAILTLVVTIPEPAQIRPVKLVWETGEPNRPKTITVKAMPGLPLRVLNVVSTNSIFTASIATIQEDKEYRITVTPKITENPGIAALKINTLLGGQPKILSAYAQIKIPRSIRPRPQ